MAKVLTALLLILKYPRQAVFSMAQGRMKNGHIHLQLLKVTGPDFQIPLVEYNITNMPLAQFQAIQMLLPGQTINWQHHLSGEV